MFRVFNVVVYVIYLVFVVVVVVVVVVVFCMYFCVYIDLFYFISVLIPWELQIVQVIIPLPNLNITHCLGHEGIVR